MIIIGLTGGIAMGKSTVASMFRARGVPVVNADDIVHGLLAQGGRAVAPIAQHFPQAVENNTVNRTLLGTLTFSDRKKLITLEKILHPLVRSERKNMLMGFARGRTPMVLLEIPLLFESGAYTLCDYVVVVSAGYRHQRRRALMRSGMTAEKFDQIVSHQMPDRQKRKNAAFVISTDRGMATTRKEVEQVLRALRTLPKKRWKPGYGS